MNGMNANAFVKSYARHQAAVNQASQEAGDYLDENGLIVCGQCGRRKQTYITIDGEKIKVPCICLCRKRKLEEEERRKEERLNQNRAARLRSASLMSGKFAQANFDGYVRRPENERALKIAKNYVNRFDEMFSRNQGLLFYGPVGTGKSFTAACIANAMLNQCRSVIMTSFVKLLQDFRSDDTEADFIRALDTVSLVIIDDLGAERNTDFALEKVYNVIDSRVRANKPLILTTNLDRREMEETQDIRCRRIYDRIFEVCYPVEMPGSSIRTAQAAIKQRRMRDLLE